MMNIRPESSAEAMTKIFGMVLFFACLVELYGLYLTPIPTHWLSNLGLSLADNSFRTLSAVGIIGAVIGGALWLQVGLQYIVLASVVALTTIGYKQQWFQVGHYANYPVVQAAVISAPKTPKTNFTNTGVALTAQQKQWCNQDDDQDGTLNRNETALAAQNCKTGQVWE
jgi:hypothetical protein